MTTRVLYFVTQLTSTYLHMTGFAFAYRHSYNYCCTFSYIYNLRNNNWAFFTFEQRDIVEYLLEPPSE